MDRKRRVKANGAEVRTARWGRRDVNAGAITAQKIGFLDPPLSLSPPLPIHLEQDRASELKRRKKGQNGFAEIFAKVVKDYAFWPARCRSPRCIALRGV